MNEKCPEKSVFLFFNGCRHGFEILKVKEKFYVLTQFSKFQRTLLDSDEYTVIFIAVHIDSGIPYP